jgi:sorbitol/mannitol transport system permease protein
MARSVKNQQKMVNTVIAWIIGLLIFFPVLWTVLTSFKTEGQAINDPPLFLFFDWTLENYAIVQERSDYMKFLWNSIFVAGGSTLLGILIAVPAAWSMAFVPTKAHQGHFIVDALHQNASCCRCTLSHLHWLY